MRRWRVVYFEDDQAQVDALKERLSDRFNLDGTNDVSSFERYLATNPDLILIDVQMKVIDGFELYNRVQDSSFYNGCPIMFISDDSNPESQIKSYLLGVDDFLLRDLELSELSARLVNKIKLHRRTALKITIGNLSLDLEKFCVFLDGEMVALSLNELRILGVILRSYPKVCTRNNVISKIWGSEPIKPSTINAHMSILNSKLKSWNYELKCKRDQLLVVKKEN